MRVLKVIHGYPPAYMAGSEVYTWNLCRRLARDAAVSVFSRMENPFAPLYQTADDREDGVLVRRVNKPSRDYTFRDKYLDPDVDDAFREFVRQERPDVVHFGHLSHLSTQLPLIAKGEFALPIVLTIHDFWMFCFRGQLVRADGRLCTGPSSEGCFECAAHFFKEWMDRGQIDSYLRHMRRVVEAFDLFLAPSRTVAEFFAAQGVPARKIASSPYGFEVDRIRPHGGDRPTGPLRLGFLGRVIPVKGVHLLLEAFHATRGDATLSVWGSAGSSEMWLRSLCAGDDRVRFEGGYHNQQVQQALDGMDVLVAPSLWLENSPLVIQEALLAKIPVITSDAGGMSELIEHGKNGFLVPLGDVGALRDLLQRLIDDPGLVRSLQPDPSRVRTIDNDAEVCLDNYRLLQPARDRHSAAVRPAPWRVTFVTNPGLCNLHCPMCDTHSEHAPKGRHALPVLDFEFVERVVQELAPHGLREIIPSTMGEPLLYPWFKEILSLAVRAGVKVNLTTNGTFPRGGVDVWAPLLLPVVSDVKFSVNGIDPTVSEAIMPGVSAWEQLENIRRYLGLKREHEQKTGQGSTTTIQATFLEENLEELPRLLRWAIAAGIDRFKGHHLWVNWPQLERQSLRRSRESMTRWNETVDALRTIARDERTPGGRVIVLDRIEPIRVGEPGRAAEGSRCPFLGREAWVEADGSFQVCCCPSKERSAFGDFGNVRSASLLDLWSSGRYREFVASWGDQPSCRKCNMRVTDQEECHD